MPLYETKFVISKKPLAFDLGSFEVNDPGYPVHPGNDPYWMFSIRAYRFEKRDGELSVSYGTAGGGIRYPAEPDFQTIKTVWNSRFEMSTAAKWDGEYFWGAELMPRVEEDELIKNTLQPLYDAGTDYPAAGWDGWYEFKQDKNLPYR